MTIPWSEPTDPTSPAPEFWPFGLAPAPEPPRVVTICGSMRFFPRMLAVAAELTSQGTVVLAPFSVIAQQDQGGDLKAMLDRLHLAKIDMSDEIVVVTDEGRYMGDSTRREVDYAGDQGIPVTFRAVRADGSPA